MDTSCRCRKAPLSCCRTVIENRIPGSGQGSFAVQRLSVRMDELERWDLSIFSRPQHPMFKDGSKVEHMTCKFLNLDFPSVPDREKFNRDLAVALRLRDKDEQQYRQVSGNAEFLSHKPNHIATVDKMAGSTLSRPSSIVSANIRQPSLGRTSSIVPSPNRYSQSSTFVGSPVLSSSAEKMSAFPLSRGSSATSDNTHSPTTQKSSTLVPPMGPLPMSPVLSDSFPWTAVSQKVDFLVGGSIPASQQPTNPDLDTQIDNFKWPIHSGDPWYPGKT